MAVLCLLRKVLNRTVFGARVTMPHLSQLGEHPLPLGAWDWFYSRISLMQTCFLTCLGRSGDVSSDASLQSAVTHLPAVTFPSHPSGSRRLGRSASGSHSGTQRGSGIMARRSSSQSMAPGLIFLIQTRGESTADAQTLRHREEAKFLEMKLGTCCLNPQTGMSLLRLNTSEP